MNVVIIGATGFIGRELVRELAGNGHEPVAVSRNATRAQQLFGADVRIQAWDGRSEKGLAAILEGADAIVNLTGESIAGGRWTADRKKKLSESRIRTGQLLAEALGLTNARPSVLVQGSATGFYGTPVESPTGESGRKGQGFLADLAFEWERSVDRVQQFVPRITWIRSGPVLGHNGGLMERLLLPFRFYSGAVVGPGSQWMSWIHIRDEVRAIRFLLETGTASGPYNLTAPEPVKMKDFIRAIAKITGKPAWLNVPAWAIKAALGEMAVETILSSQNIYPEKLLKEGFRFLFPEFEPALTELLTNTSAHA